MSVVAIGRGDVLIADQSGKAQLVSDGNGLATLTPIDASGGGGFGTSPFGISGFGGGQPYAAGDAKVIPAIGQATLQTT